MNASFIKRLSAYAIDIILVGAIIMLIYYFIPETKTVTNLQRNVAILNENYLNKQINTGEYIKEITHGGADVVLDCVGMDGKMSGIEKVETLLKLQGGSKSAIEIASQAVRKCGTVVLVGVYGARYNMFPLGDFFSRNITLKMGQCPAQRYVDPIMELIKKGEFDATDIITHTLKLDEGKHAYEIFDKKLEDCIKVVLKP